MLDITISETNTDRRYTIEDEENVIRLLSIPSCLNSNGRLTPVAFSLYHNNEDYVSISRLFYSSRDECIELGKKIKVWASKGDEFAGLAELNAGKIRSISSTLAYFKITPHLCTVLFYQQRRVTAEHILCVGIFCAHT